MQSSFKEYFQLIVFQKLSDWRLEKSYMKNHTCLLDHHQRSHYDTITIGPEGMINWVLQLINSQKVKLFDSHEEKFNTQRSPNWPNQSPNQSVIDQGNLITRKMCLLLKVKRPVPMRSMKKVFTENSVLQIDQGNLIICLRTSKLSKFTIDQGNLMSVTAQMHTWGKNNMLLKYIVKLHYSTRTTSSIVKSTRRTSTSTFQDYHIPQWSNCMAPAFENWFRKSRSTRIDMLFNATCNRVNHLILSVKNQNKWFMKLWTSNCVNYSIRNPKHSARYAYHTGTSASSTARAGTSCETELRRTRNLSSTLLASFRFPTTTSRKGDPTGTVTGRSQEITSTASRTRSRRNARRSSIWVSTTGSSETRSSTRICLTPVARRNCVARWTNWRTKTIRTTWLQKKFEATEPTGGFVQTKLVPIRCQSGIDLTSSKHCQPCDSSKTKRMQLISKDGCKAIPRLGGNGKNPGGILLMSITTKTYPALIDPGKPDEKWLGHLFEVWFSELICWSTV